MKKYVINLDCRADRLQSFYQAIEPFRFEVERYKAVEVPSRGSSSLLKGEIGCKESHRNIIKIAKESGYDNVMIFEDDFEPLDGFLEQYTKIVNNLPHMFNFIQFGANVMGLVEKYDENLNRCYGMFAAHCYIINSSIYDEILSNTEDLQIDVIYKNIHARGHSYLSNKTICRQRADYSNIQNSHVYYGFLL